MPLTSNNPPPFRKGGLGDLKRGAREGRQLITRHSPLATYCCYRFLLHNRRGERVYWIYRSAFETERITKSYELRVMSKRHWIRLIIHYPLLITLFCTISCLLFTNDCFAKEDSIITSETLEYLEDTSTYIAKGSVKVT